jgi:hypothetical protein
MARRILGAQILLDAEELQSGTFVLLAQLKHALAFSVPISREKPPVVLHVEGSFLFRQADENFSAVSILGDVSHLGHRGTFDVGVVSMGLRISASKAASEQ